MDVGEPVDETTPVLATLNSRQRTLLSQVSQDIHATVSHLSLPKVSALSVLTPEAIDNLKDLYYMLNTEDPLNSMPVRQHVLSSGLAGECLLPIAVAAHKDPSSQRNRKRWALPTYQTLRILSVLTLPISTESELPVPAPLDHHLVDLRTTLATHTPSLVAFVALLQYYIDRKAEKQAALVPAEQAKLEDARIDNILRFFTNILSPPRDDVPQALFDRDRPVHLALVGALVSTEFYSTLSVLFSTPEDARSHFTDLVFLVSEIFALTYRHTTPRQLYRFSRQHDRKTTEKKLLVKSPTKQSVFDKPSERALAVQKPDLKPRRSSTSALRDALARDRSIGAARAITASARWSNRHSGAITAVPREQQSRGKAPATVGMKRISSTRSAVTDSKGFNPMYDLQQALGLNSELLCLNSAKRRRVTLMKKTANQIVKTVRRDLQEAGMSAMVGLTEEMIDVSFKNLVRELRERIIETKERAVADESGILCTAKRSFLAIVAAGVGYQREARGKVYKTALQAGSKSSLMHENSMKAIINSDFKIVEQWKDVEAAVDLESLALVFDVLVETCDQLKESGKNGLKVSTVEMATCTLLEMMKLLEGMSAVKKNDDDTEGDDEDELSPRDISLTRMEELFEKESYLTAPAELAKQFTARLFSFQHLSNIVELAHTLTSILLNEKEFRRLQVAKKKRRTKAKSKEDVKEIEKDPEFNPSKEVQRTSDEAHVTPESKPDDSASKADSAGSEADNAESRADDVASKAEDAKANIGDGETKLDKLSDSPEKDDQPLSDNKRLTDAAQAANDKQTEPTCLDDKRDGAVSKTVSDDESNVPSKPSAAESEKDASGDGEASGTNAAMDDNVSKIKSMLAADEKDAAKNRPEVAVESKVQKMLLADQQAVKDGQPQPKYVLNKEEAFSKDMVDVNSRVVADIDAEESDDEIDLRMINSTSIVRRFAHTKALETLLVPLRTALCQASELSGQVYPTPDGSQMLNSATVVAKSANVISSIWEVAKDQERGGPCGQFFNFSILHTLNIAMVAGGHLKVDEKSVLGSVRTLAEDVTKEFMTWLTVNPALMYEIFFPMDKTTAKAYASASMPLRRQNERIKRIGSQEQAREGSGSEYSSDGQEENESDLDTMVRDKETKAASKGSGNGSSKKTRKRKAKGLLTEDEDIDVDDLEIAPKQMDNEDEEGKQRWRRGPRGRKDSASDSDCDVDGVGLGRAERRKRPPKKRRGLEMKRNTLKRKSGRVTVGSDSDVDDLDQLKLGVELEDSDDARPEPEQGKTRTARRGGKPGAKKSRKLATASRIVVEDDDSDDARPVDGDEELGKKEGKKVFDSSSEYSE